jgi:hypothetical protein
MKAYSLSCALLLPLALAGCSSDDGNSGASTGDPSGLEQYPSISECGGFVQGGNPGAKIDPPKSDPATYCDAERLLWIYDAATQSLGLSNTRVVLNCCGDHTINVVQENGTLILNERDAPQANAGGARCSCQCVFDFTVSVEPIPAGSLPIRLVLDVTDSGKPPEVVYGGSLDLSQGSGDVTIDTTSAEPWCISAAP